MNIQTKYLGEVKINQDKILKFPQGILGFESSQEFIILDIAGNSGVQVLQDLKEASVAFFIINPWNFYQDYIVDIPDEELRRISIFSDNENDLAVFNIVTLGKTFKESTANLLAPIIINMANKEGKQFIQNDTKYTTRHSLFTQGIGG